MTPLTYSGEDFKWGWCPTCRCAFVRCPQCGNSSCNGGYGRLKMDGRECPTCPQAYDIQSKGRKSKSYPLKYRALELLYRRVLHPVKLNWSNFVYWIKTKFYRR